MTRNNILIKLFIIHSIVIFQVLLYGFGSHLEAKVIIQILTQIITPLAVYGYVLNHPKLPSTQLLKQLGVKIFVWSNYVWAIFCSLLLFFKWGPVGNHLSSEDFSLYMEVINSGRLFAFSLFIPAFFPQSK